MEKIDMDLIIRDQYSRWTEDDVLERNELLARFPHSIQVATSYDEMDYVEQWLVKVIGPKGNNWDCIFYYKESYDFGYAEYFFLEKGASIIFENEIPKVYYEYPNGKSKEPIVMVIILK